MTYYLLGGFAPIPVTNLLAQAPQFEAYGLAEGLSQEYVNALVKDRRGFLWIGTQDGLNRFDGYTFKHYRRHKKDPHGLPGNFINALALDSLGRIWVGTKNHGLAYGDPLTERFHRVVIEGLAANAHCNQLTVDPDGTVYAAFLSEGIVKISPRGDSLHRERLNFAATATPNITTLQAFPDFLLAGSREGALYYADRRLAKPEFQRLAPDFAGQKIHAFAAFRELVLIGTDAGVFYWRPGTPRVQKLRGLRLNGAYVYEMATDEEAAYFATDAGLFYASDFNGQDGFDRVRHYTSDGQSGLQSNLITQLLLEAETLWLGGNRLYYHDRRPPVFKSIASPLVANRVVYSLVVDGDRTWVGTGAGLLLVRGERVYAYGKAAGLPHSKVRHLAIDREGYLWVGTQKGVVLIDRDAFDPERPQLRDLPQHPVDSLRLGQPKVRDITVDAVGRVWIATLGKGLYRFVGTVAGEDFRFQHFAQRPGELGGLNTNVCYALTQDRGGRYWIGTEDGVNTLRLDTDGRAVEWASFRHSPEDRSSLSNNTVLSFCEDQRGNLWIGTLQGLNRYLPESNRFRVYDEEDGLSNAVVYAIVEAAGRLWLSTNAGIFAFDPETERFERYHSGDGLRNEEFTLGAATRDSLGQLYFGGGRGYDFFHPRDLAALNREGQLVFTDLKVGETARPMGDRLRLEHDEFPVYLQFSDLRYGPQKNATFRYQLSPGTAQWHQLGERRELQLLDLAPGDYELRVQGQTRGQSWSTPALAIALEVRPPWWRSRGMYLVYLLVSLGLLYGGYRLLLARHLQREETKKLQEIDALKSQLYTNITHEFRTPITVIKGLAKHLQEQLPERTSSAAFRTLDTIQHNSSRVLQLVNQLLDLARMEQRRFVLHYVQSDVAWYLERIVAQFSSYAAARGTTLTFYSETPRQLMDFDRDALQKVLGNLLSNALKNSEREDTVIVHLRVEGEEAPRLILKVKDTGRGIPAGEVARIFDPFYQAERGNGTLSEGSGIGLSLTRELVQLMGGTIAVESVEHQGSTFTVVLPIRNTAELERAPELLVDAFALRPPVALEATAPEAEAGEQEKKVILVVDDNEDIRSLLRLSLGEHYRVLTAGNGREGVAVAIEHLPDVVISDVMMSDTDGYELCAQLKANDKTNHIPIILLTAKATDQDRLRGLSRGADAFITKPFQQAELFIRIEELLKLRQLLYQKYATASAWDAVERSELEDQDAAFINRVLYHIEQQLDDPQLNAARLAQKLALSESQLYRKLKALTGSSTANFIRKVRLQKAKSLLQSTAATVSEIAYQTGFRSPSWFSRAFKQEFGYAPNEMRK
ncbi:MAG: two-component regulator propeller domain-containing protein [Bacteroidota bacterium]